MCPSTQNGGGNPLQVPGTGSGGTPSGSNGEVQFNDSGAFGADSQFYFKKTDNWLRLGPDEGPFGPPASVSGVEDSGSPQNYFLGDTSQIRVYAVFNDGLDNYFSDNYETSNLVTISASPPGSNYSSIDWSWSSVTGATDYLLIRDKNLGGFIEWCYVGSATTSIHDDGLTIWNTTSIPNISVKSGSNLYNYTSTFDSALYAVHSQHFGYFGKIGIGTLPTYRFDVYDPDPNAGRLSTFKRVAQSSTSPSVLACIDEHDNECAALSNWAGGGGVYGNYGALVLSNEDVTGGVRFGEISGKNLDTSTRLNSIIFQSASGAPNDGQIVFLNGRSGSFYYCQFLDEYGRNGFSGVTSPTAKVHIASSDGSTNNGQLKLDASTLMVTPEDGLFEFDGSNLYFTIGGVQNLIV